MLFFQPISKKLWITSISEWTFQKWFNSPQLFFSKLKLFLIFDWSKTFTTHTWVFVENLMQNKWKRFLPCMIQNTYLRTFWTRNPATIPIVVGKLAAQTPSRLRVFSSIFEATINGGQQAKQATSPGFKNWIWPDL